jgi:hypothetical protein
VFGLFPEVGAIVAVPQAANHASRRALEKAGFSLVGERTLDSDDPSDAGPSAVYALTRPMTAGLIQLNRPWLLGDDGFTRGRPVRAGPGHAR